MQTILRNTPVYQKIGLSPFDNKYSFDFEKGREPKKPV